MGRMIDVSTEVFATIWAQRQDGEESENAILSRILGLHALAPQPPTEVAKTETAIGVYDSRNGVSFPAGFEIFRSYKGQKFTAQARDGVWVRQSSGETFPTLNQLNDSIVAGQENVWNGNWRYVRKDGTVGSIDELRK
ncbi:hypothetical protein [Sphingorhabdus sp.]|uniref:hypothetical protein n=1 Tax=Sphingorhabdus sp. TaxID=1902408 RepID=UPI00391AD80B